MPTDIPDFWVNHKNQFASSRGVPVREENNFIRKPDLDFLLAVNLHFTPISNHIPVYVVIFNPLFTQLCHVSETADDVTESDSTLLVNSLPVSYRCPILISCPAFTIRIFRKL